MQRGTLGGLRIAKVSDKKEFGYTVLRGDNCRSGFGVLDGPGLP